LLQVKPRTHVLLTGLDYERIEHGLRMFPAYRVCIVENGFPKEEHKVLVEEINDRLMEILKRLGYKDENIVHWPINFYDFGDALASIYELLLQETKEGHEVILNITSGTKPVALAATLAGALAKCGIVYFAAKEYRRGSHGEVVSKGVIQEPVYIGPLFELVEILLPHSEEEMKILLYLLKKDSKEAKSVTEILSEGGKKPNKKEIAKYAYYVNKLSKEKLLNIEKNAISLTELGILIAKLIQKRIKILGYV